MTQAAEILIIDQKGIAVYNEFRNQLAELKAQNANLIFDYETPKGNKDARSYVYKLRQTKSAVEAARKREKQESLEYGRKVDAEAKEITVDLEDMIKVHQERLDEIEQRETKRIDGIKYRIADITKYQQCAGHDVKETASAIKHLESVSIDESFAEFQEMARTALEASLHAQRAQYALAIKAESDAAELARLRAQDAERQKKENEARAAQEAEAQEKAANERMEFEAREAENRRKKDSEHRARIQEGICTALLQFRPNIPFIEVQAIVELIDQGLVPHLSIKY